MRLPIPLDLEEILIQKIHQFALIDLHMSLAGLTQERIEEIVGNTIKQSSTTFTAHTELTARILVWILLFLSAKKIPLSKGNEFNIPDSSRSISFGKDKLSLSHDVDA